MQAHQDHRIVINITDVAETEKFSEVAGLKTDRRRGGDTAWAVTRYMPELLRPEMRGRQVKTGVACDRNHPRRRYYYIAERSLRFMQNMFSSALYCCLLGRLHKNHSIDFHRIRWKDGIQVMIVHAWPPPAMRSDACAL